MCHSLVTPRDHLKVREIVLEEPSGLQPDNQVILVDTPGFDNHHEYEMSDEQILILISEWLGTVQRCCTDCSTHI